MSPLSCKESLGHLSTRDAFGGNARVSFAPCFCRGPTARTRKGVSFCERRVSRFCDDVRLTRRAKCGASCRYTAGLWSGREDLNLRPLPPESAALSETYFNSTRYAHWPRANVTGKDKSGLGVTGVSHDLVTLVSGLWKGPALSDGLVRLGAS